MALAARIALGFVAIQHILFMVLEMFLWTKPFGRRAFGLSEQLANDSAALAANQGLYNGFLAAGLIWAMVPGPHAIAVGIFFTACVVVAGVFGGLTAKRSILVVQALPGAIALALVLASRG
jgi:putative membrane protein